MNNILISNLHVDAIFQNGKVVRYRISFEVEIEESRKLITSFPEYGKLIS